MEHPVLLLAVLHNCLDSVSHYPDTTKDSHEIYQPKCEFTKTKTLNYCLGHNER